MNRAVEAGFYPKDMFVLTVKAASLEAIMVTRSMLVSSTVTSGCSKTESNC